VRAARPRPLPARALTRRRARSIVPRHIQLAIRNDEELSKLLGKGESPLLPPPLLPATPDALPRPQ
jgi:hypothetical protein